LLGFAKAESDDHGTCFVKLDINRDEFAISVVKLGTRNNSDFGEGFSKQESKADGFLILVI
jgi:hypothetical protein